MCDRARHLVARPFVLALVASLATAPIAAQTPATDDALLIGTWRLDLAKSKYFPGPPPRSETRTYARSADGIRGVIDRVYADGRRETIEYGASADRDQTVTGTPAYDAIKLQKVDDRTWVSTLSHAGIVFGTARRVISPDGNTMTITFERRTADDTVRNIAVYHKEAH